MSLAPGTRIGTYEILAKIGEGGMGEVYRARDTKLGRDVALKVLPEALARDADQLARLRREAQVLASLNDPHIAHVYGLEDSGDTHALVMELVEGPTLADRIAGGPLPLEEALSMARQIAEGLEAAHEQGVVHRDLKPANVKVRADGRVKVLDFGLARPAEFAADSGAVANSPTFTSPVMTRRGVIMGTAAYMSPEQARGKPVDKRADIWAFGCVLYEMLTGERAFPGDAVADHFAGILERNPDFDALPRQLPASVRRLVRRCLDKDPKERLRDIGEARIALGLALAGRSAEETAEATASSDGERRALPQALLDDERRRDDRVRGFRAAGLIIMASGIGVGALLYALLPTSGIYVVGFLAFLVGAAFFLSGYVLAPGNGRGRP